MDRYGADIWNTQHCETPSVLDLIPLETLQEIQDALAEAGAVVSVITDPAGNALTLPSNDKAICRKINRTAGGATACLASKDAVTAGIGNNRQTVFTSCRPLGFPTAVVPLFIGDCHIANWWIEQPCAHQELRDKLHLLAARTGMEPEGLLTAIENLPECNPLQFKRTVGWLENLIAHIVRMSHQNMVLGKENSKLSRIEDELQLYKNRLEGFVQERTAELIKANNMLQLEVMERDLVEEQKERKSLLLDAINKILQQNLNDHSARSLQNAFLEAAKELSHSLGGFLVEKTDDGWHLGAVDISVPGALPERSPAIGEPFELRGGWRRVVNYGEKLYISDKNELSDLWIPRHCPEMSAMMAVPLKEKTHVAGFIVLFNNPQGYALVDLSDIEALARVFMETLLRKKSEQAKHQNERRLNLALDSANEGLWDYLPQEEKLYFSPSCFTMLGYQNNEFPSSMETWTILTHPDDFPALEDRVRKTSRGGEEGFSLDIRMLAQGGIWTWIQARGRIVELDTRGNVVRVVGTLSDISKYKQVEMALQKANEELQRLAVLDSLTQIANRLRFDDRLAQEWRRARRERKPLSVVLCDIDYFKDYNDTYGHLKGDEILYTIAQTISGTLKRPMDLIARYGGEEFAMVLPNTDLRGAMRVANEVKTALDALKIEHKASKVNPCITLSFGVTSLIPNGEQSPRTLVEAADSALYRAKKQGRNRIIKIPETVPDSKEQDGEAA